MRVYIHWYVGPAFRVSKFTTTIVPIANQSLAHPVNLVPQLCLVVWWAVSGSTEDAWPITDCISQLIFTTAFFFIANPVKAMNKFLFSCFRCGRRLQTEGSDGASKVARPFGMRSATSAAKHSIRQHERGRRKEKEEEEGKERKDAGKVHDNISNQRLSFWPL